MGTHDLRMVEEVVKERLLIISLASKLCVQVNSNKFVLKFQELLVCCQKILNIFCFSGFSKISLKMISKIASQCAHPENESCLLRTAVMTVFTF